MSSNLLPHCPTCGSILINPPQLIIDPDQGLIIDGDKTAHLSRKEMSIFNLLYKNRPRTITHEFIYDSLYFHTDKIPSDKAFSTFICVIRKKTKGMPSFMIRTEWGRGWSLRTFFNEKDTNNVTDGERIDLIKQAFLYALDQVDEAIIYIRDRQNK